MNKLAVGWADRPAGGHCRPAQNTISFRRKAGFMGRNNDLTKKN
jgi:hypothetical protein